MLTMSFWRRNWRKPANAVVVLLPLACILWVTGLFSPSLMRVENKGSSDLQDLTVRFPRGRVEFGNVPAGQISGYRLVFGGVYRFPAYSFTVDGEPISQPVADWVGAVPLLPGVYTYIVSLNETSSDRPWLPWLDLLEVRQFNRKMD